MTASIVRDGAQSGWLKIKVEGEATAAHNIASVANPEGALLQINRAFLYIEEGAHAASSLHLGIGADGADVHDIMDGFLLNQTDGTVWNVIGTDIAEEGSLAEPNGALWGATEYLTMTTADQVSTGLLAYLFVEYTRLA
jgi:hypothetical protein